MRLLLIGDIVGKPGRQICTRALGKLRIEEKLDLIVANAENAAGGSGITPVIYHELIAAGIPADQVTVTPPPRPALPDTPAEGPPSILFAGRLAAAKGVWDAANAWRISGVDLPLVFAGTGPERGRLDAAGHRVLGWVERPRLAGLLRAAAVLVLPSRWQEPYGLIGPEALSLGTPVAAWESGAVSEWHPGGSLLVPWGDVHALGGALNAAVQS